MATEAAACPPPPACLRRAFIMLIAHTNTQIVSGQPVHSGNCCSGSDRVQRGSIEGVFSK